ncbi:flagellar hook-associated protein FlgL [Dickeya fangzhongdai]|uniref:Flagellar hook-filament junction protein FlgL n=1 Tax=Dickeya fangzhongdai TaxID=1778540 RepID=A0A2K8QNG3_9GAMM|nr:flagellar hook-associated protein FlgL [Dickeya fangzhongdai]ATZ95026.1 flagellar hook-filament junction protein FlgL [Dickeya fangzhongdai]QOH48468.1 flagellar hook-filament junction protein FlgL [Dickeya fangzhongdai]QOH52771.1 flagellar hook-filament junction protein FlgL [Dickeya fangzhongdai]ULR29710.1 flagellar hook-associated protein FlgL [Dickeya fangzhongdai]UMB75321.1 flagellar hook-associated protein FlgL [Dickeya fangzhongdai]
MRLSTSIIFQQSMQGVTDGLSSFSKTGQQLASNTRVLTPSDDPIAASKAVMVNQAQAQNEQYTLARTFAENGMNSELSVLTNVATALTSASTTLLSADGTKNDNDRQLIATSLRGLKSQLLNLANSTDGNGSYVFGGYKTDSQPFTTNASGTVSYVGGNQAISQQVDADRIMTVGHIGSDVFNNASGTADIFSALDSAISALETPLEGATDAVKSANTASISAASQSLKNALTNVSSAQATLGVQLQEIDTLDSIGTDRTTANKQTLSDLVDIDMVATISTYMMQQQSLQASYKAFSDMQSLSLFQLNK